MKLPVYYISVKIANPADPSLSLIINMEVPRDSIMRNDFPLAEAVLYFEARSAAAEEILQGLPGDDVKEVNAEDVDSVVSKANAMRNEVDEVLKSIEKASKAQLN